MGHELTREARAVLAAGCDDWSHAQRNVVLLLADICNDHTRRPPKHMDVSRQLCKEAKLTMGSLGNILSRLAADGYEFRVVAGKDKQGNAVFAHKGHAVDYQFPYMRPHAPEGPSTDGPNPVDNPPEGPSTNGPLTAEGPSGSGPNKPKGPLANGQRSIPQWTPNPTNTNQSRDDTLSSLSTVTTVPAAIIRKAFPDATTDEIQAIVQNKTARGAKNVEAVLRHEIERGTLRLPCDRHSAGKHTEACRSGDSDRCTWSWCECRCHLKPASTDKDSS